METITNFQIVLNVYQKNPKLNQPNPKNTCPNFPTQKIPKSEISNPEKILQSSLSLENRSTPWDSCSTLLTMN